MSIRRSRLLLLVESPDLGGILQLALREFELEWHVKPAPARDAFRRRAFDLALVDLPAGGRPQALDLIRDWRAAGDEMPIVAISDLPQPGLAIECLDAGADDFLRKPFHCSELLARMRKLLQRRRRETPVRKAGGVLLGAEEFWFAGAVVTPDLTVRFPNGASERVRPKQHGILREFARAAGTLLLKEELIEAVWGSDANHAGHSVNEYISGLRRLFREQGSDFSALVLSEPKAGWRIAVEAARRPDFSAS